jgi:uncharacterized damage-inducible protein DinB
MFQQQSADYLKSEYLAKIELAIDPLTAEQIWWRPNDASNSIGNLMLHLAGNVRQWIVGGVSGQDVDRNRDWEFSTRDQLSTVQLTKRLRAVVDDACAVIVKVPDDELGQPRTIQGFETTVFGAIYHVVEHFAMHTGQIILLAKAPTAKDAGFYRARADGTLEELY